MLTQDLQFDLPEEQIALTPAPSSEQARLMVVRMGAGTIEHARVEQLPQFLNKNDLLLFNDTRVAPCRVELKAVSGKIREGLLFAKDYGDQNDALPETHGAPISYWWLLAKKLKAGERLWLGGMPAVVGPGRADGVHRFLIDAPAAVVETYLEKAGKMPLPPYILKRRSSTGNADFEQLDRQRYQSALAAPSQKYSHWSIAAPTASLHFTPSLLSRLDAREVEREYVTLHVGRTTFNPIKSEDVRDHEMGFEWFNIPATTQEKLQTLRQRGGRLIPVGTTAMRALEGWGAAGTASGWTQIYIYPGYEFKVWRPGDGLMTNFHLPGSTLLLLVMAIAGPALVKRAYAEAVAAGYRFYSYGDGMLILP